MSAEQHKFGRVLIVAAVVAISLGTGVTLTLVYLWREASKPREWDAAPVTAAFAGASEWDDVDANGRPLNRGHFEFRYILENHAASDYRLSDFDNPTIMTKRGAHYELAPDVRLKLPLLVPAKHRVLASLNVPFDVFDQVASKSSATSEPVIPGLTPESSHLFREKFKDTSGFAVFDSTVRYRIDLPRAW